MILKHILLNSQDKQEADKICKILNKEYFVTLITSERETLGYLEHRIPDLLILNEHEKGEEGLAFLKKLKEIELISSVPVIYITDCQNGKAAECLQLGASDFIIKPYNEYTMCCRVGRTIELEELRKNLEIEVEKKSKEIEKITLQALMAIANTIDAKDQETEGHSIRVARYARAIAKKLGWEEKQLIEIGYVALLHDIGKICISEKLLGKNGALTPEEYEVIKKHTVIGADILKDFRVLHNVMDGAKYHHEWYDGNGYTEGKKGEEIPMNARIISVAEAYDAMNTDRRYRKRLSQEEIIKELKEGRGSQFDPRVVDVMLRLIEEGIEEDDTIPNIVSTESDFAEESSALLHKVLTDYAEEIKSVANTDDLTGLWNRNYTEKNVNAYLSERRNAGALLMMDLDNFKTVNDNYGHIVGDELLKEFATILKTLTRQDDLVCRMGGDEFLIFLKDISSRATVSEKAEQILIMLQKHLIKPDLSNSVSISMGIAMAPADGRDFLTLYQNADKSLYYVKQNGKNSYHFYSEEERYETGTLKHKSTQIDLEHLRSFIQEMGYKKGAYQVEYEGFKKIYRFVARCIGRTGQKVQTVLFTLSDEKGNLPNLDQLLTAMELLHQSVNISIRRADVVTNYSSSQYLVILMDSSIEDGITVADRIVDKFKLLYNDNQIELRYDIQSVSAAPISKDFDNEVW